MSQLFFKKPLQTAIREGRKRTTIRRWDRPRLRAGQVAFAPGVGWLAIERVELVELDRLADADARADGFDTLGDLRGVLLSLYPDHASDGKQWSASASRSADSSTPRRRLRPPPTRDRRCGSKRRRRVCPRRTRRDAKEEGRRRGKPLAALHPRPLNSEL